MERVLISIPDQLASRLRAAIPRQQRSKTIARLIEKEIEKREKHLFEYAQAVENDSKLNKEMEDWNVTLNDEINNDKSWQYLLGSSKSDSRIRNK